MGSIVVSPKNVTKVVMAMVSASRTRSIGLIMSDPDEPSSFSTDVDRGFMEKVIEAAIYRAPILEKAEILRGWAGLYAITPDENPVIGVMPGVEGLFTAIGFSGHGFQQGPAVGQILCDLILESRTDFDLRPFAFGRFEKNENEGERRAV